jgi:hypothetical protein
MQFLVSEEIRLSASGCTKGQTCLSGGSDGLCQVVFCVNCKLLGILCREETFCTYKHVMEDRTCCTCPVRLEIYTKYKL